MLAYKNCSVLIDTELNTGAREYFFIKPRPLTAVALMVFLHNKKKTLQKQLNILF